METFFIKPAALALLLWALPFFCFSQYTYQYLHVDLLTNPLSLKNNSYQNLRLYPVFATDDFRKAIGYVSGYTALQDAIQKKKVKITEKNNDGSVNDLTIPSAKFLKQEATVGNIFMHILEERSILSQNLYCFATTLTVCFIPIIPVEFFEGHVTLYKKENNKWVEAGCYCGWVS